MGEKYITIFEIDAPLDVTTFINESPGVWQKSLTPGLATFDDGKGIISFYGNRDTQRKRVESLRVDGVDYAEQLSLADCRSNQQSFYFDPDTQIIVIHFVNSSSPALFSRIRIGSAFGWADKTDSITDNVWDGVSYPPLLLSVPSIRKSRDPFLFGVVDVGGGGAIDIENSDGRLDNFSELDLFGQPGRLYQILEGGVLDESGQLLEGIVGTFENTNWEILTINLRDPRAALNTPLATNNIANIYNENQEGQVAPVAYGPQRNAPCYRTTDTGNTKWVFCDTEFNAVNAAGFTVYADGVDVTVSVSGTITDGTFLYTPASDQVEVTCDFEVSGFDTIIDIIQDIFLNYLNVAYNTSNYDQTEWEAARAIANDTSVYLPKTTRFRKVIEQGTAENQGIFEFRDNGKRTFRIFDKTADPVKQLKNLELGEGNSELLSTFNVRWPDDEFLSQVEIEYSQNRSTERFKRYINRDFVDEVKNRYNEEKNLVITTGLRTEPAAAALSAKVMDRSKEIPPTAFVTVFLPDNKDLRVLDFVVLNRVRPDGTSGNIESYEILSYNRRVTDLEIDLVLRKVIGGSIVVPDDDDLVAAVYNGSGMVYDGQFAWG